MFVDILDVNVPKSAFCPLNFTIRYSHFDYPYTLFSNLMVIEGVFVSYGRRDARLIKEID
jgi:hypothetical protein